MTAAPTAGAIIASTPTILGYIPQHALVVMTFRRGHRGVTTAVSLPASDALTISTLADWTTSVQAEVAVAIVVDSDTRETNQTNPHRHLAHALKSALADRGVHLIATHAVPEICAGARWVCADGCGDSGLVDDPITTPVAIFGVVTGRRVYASQTALYAAVEPIDAQHTAAVSSVVESTRDAFTAECDDDQARKAIEDTLAAAKRVSRGATLSNTEYVQLARVLADARIRDMLLGLAITSKAPRVELLWTTLARSMPEPWRVEALVMLAFFAFGRGDQPLAGAAITTALDSDPTHPMANTVDAALRTGQRPRLIRELAEVSYLLAQLADIPMPKLMAETRI